MTFDRPLLLLTLLVVPAALGLYLLAERRRMRYAIRFTNLEVLTSVLGRRLWRQVFRQLSIGQRELLARARQPASTAPGLWLTVRR